MKGYLTSVQAEFRERVFSSPKRLIKFIAIAFVPFLYAFVCIAAFWNPIPKLGDAPMALVNNDQTVVLVGGKDAQGKLALGAAVSYYTTNSADTHPITPNTPWDDIKNGATIVTNSGTEITKDSNTIHSNTNVLDDLTTKWKNNDTQNINYDANSDKFSIKVNDGMTLTNVKYLNGTQAQAIAEQNQDGSWNVKDQDKYWVQMQIPQHLTNDLLGYLDATIREINGGTPSANAKTPNDFLNDLKTNSMQFWSTYKHNFLFGQFMYIFNEFKSSLLVDLAPNILQNVVTLFLEKEFDIAQKHYLLIAPEDVNEELTIPGDHRSPDSKTVTFKVKQNHKYVIRNNEMLNAIKAQHGSWTFPDKTLEGVTGTVPNQSWTDGVLSTLADQWNNLFNNTGTIGNVIASGLATTISQTATDKLQSLFPGSKFEITADAIKKLFASAENIAGLLEQDATLIPGDSPNNFITRVITGDDTRIYKYKELIGIAKGFGIFSQLKLIGLLDDGQESEAYVIEHGDLTNPIPGTFAYNITNNINVITNIIFGGNTNITAFFAHIKQNIDSVVNNNVSGLLPDFSGIIKTNIVGSQFNPYGIGLGQFFLCIGLWVGALMQTFIYDRAKRSKNASPFAWYLSKTTLMLVTSWVQCTIMMLAVYAFGWSMIGPAFGLVYLWMMFTATVFVIIIQALWFSFRDETIGKFLCIILLIINLSSGWGTFPTFMQSKFFDILSYIAPYTYSIHGQGAIIYSIAINGSNWTDAAYVLQQFGILLIWLFGFLMLGFSVAIFRHREMFYGTHSSKKLGVVLLAEGLTQYVNPKTKRAIWAKLPKTQMPQICQKVKERFLEEKQFKWYQKWKAKQPPDKSLKASDSDEEIMRRNE